MQRAMRSPPVLPRAVLLFLLFAFALPAAAWAQGASPSLTARIAGVNSEEAQSRKLRIETLDIRVRVHGTIAETIVTARFANEGQQILEGDFTLAMPAGSVVTGYALDVNGRMVDGVLVDQRQGRIAYEARVRRRIDPGLAEVGRDNLFRTRVFPIAPGSGRTIQLSFATPLDPRAGYVLPLSDTGEIGAFSLEVEASGMARPPRLMLPGDGNPRWTSDGDTHRYAVSHREAGLDGPIVIEPPEPAAAMLVSRHANGERFFQISDAAAPAGGEAPPVRSVAVLWDRSLSRADDDLDKEIALVDRYLERVRPQAIELILFDSGGAERIRARDAGDLVARLRAVRYRGATSLAVLAGQRLAGADACLLFSDGLVTIDRGEGFQPDCPLFVLSSANDADRAFLASLARGAGGEAYDLSVRESGEVLGRMIRRVPRVTDVRASGGARVDYTLLDGGEQGWRIVGRMPASGDVVVRLSGLAAGAGERLYSAGGAPVEANGAGALWAADRAALLAASDERDRDALVAFSRRYSVASPDVSFIVLETGRDYATSKIEPPATLPAELLAEYRQVRDALKQEETGARSQRLETVLAGWQEMRTWWARRFPVRQRIPRGRRGIMPPVQVQAIAPPSLPVPAPPAPVEENALPVARDSDDSAIMITGSRIPGRAGASAPGRADRPGRGTIAIEPWAPDRPYLVALEAARPADRDRVFAEQQRIHGALPAFWLDVADWAWRKGRRAEAVQLVLSALELPTRNSQTLSIVADRLMRYGEVDRAIWLYERLLAAEDDRPQPRRTLALALAARAQSAPREQARADLARAISLLTEVVITPWNNAYDGIEMIALMEANRLIPRYRALGGGALGLDPRLIALLDVDLRVVIEWNSEATDIDLWVDEPGGERAIYHNPRTAVGGHLSNDMTQGFGPEEYFLRRAPRGAYEVRANVFAADQLNPNGAQRVTARIIRDYGRATEREEVVDIELLPDDQTRERRVGTVTFATNPRGRGPARRPARNRGRQGSRR
jgi:tetratricopeptide (TPR) repeat protein